MKYVWHTMSCTHENHLISRNQGRRDSCVCVRVTAIISYQSQVEGEWGVPICHWPKCHVQLWLVANLGAGTDGPLCHCAPNLDYVGGWHWTSLQGGGSVHGSSSVMGDSHLSGLLLLWGEGWDWGRRNRFIVCYIFCNINSTECLMVGCTVSIHQVWV